MQDETKECWRQLCEQAGVERDPQELLEFVREINHLIEQQQLGLENDVEIDARRNQALNDLVRILV